jgi:transposase-like protein
MKTSEITCPRCGSVERQNKDGFTPAGSQRYRCKLCKTRYTPKPKEHGYDEDIRLQALSLHLEGLSLREISGLLSVNHQSVSNWVNDYANHMPTNLPTSILEIAILDGFYSPPKSLRKRGSETRAKQDK